MLVANTQKYTKQVKIEESYIYKKNHEHHNYLLDITKYFLGLLVLNFGVFTFPENKHLAPLPLVVN